MARTAFYNRATSTVVIDGVVVEGVAAGDAIRIIPEADMSSTTQGLQNAETSINNDLRARLEIDLQATSVYIPVFNSMARRQAEGSGRLFDASVRTGVNESEKLQGMTIRNRGEIRTGGSEAQLRTAVFSVERWVGDES